MKKNIIIAGAIIIVAGASFFAGTKSSLGRGSVRDDRQMMAFTGQGPGGGARAGTGGFRMGNLVAGELLSVSAESVTVKLRDGGSKIVFLPKEVSITKSVDGVVGDLKVGETVVVTGAINQDGSVNAESIQIRPEFMTTPAGAATPSTSIRADSN